MGPELTAYEIEHIACSIVEELRAAGLEIKERDVTRLTAMIAVEDSPFEYSLISMKVVGERHKIDKMWLRAPFSIMGPQYDMRSDQYVNVLDWGLNRIGWLTDRINRRIHTYISNQRLHWPERIEK